MRPCEHANGYPAAIRLRRDRPVSRRKVRSDGVVDVDGGHVDDSDEARRNDRANNNRRTSPASNRRHHNIREEVVASSQVLREAR